MITQSIKGLLVSVFLTLLISGCTTDDTYLKQEAPITLEFNNDLKQAQVIYYDNQGFHDHNHSAKSVDGFTETFESASKASYSEANVTVSTSDGFMETFESGSKGSYSGDNVTVSSGDWFLDDALIGTLSNDRKYSSRSIRIQNSGYAIMEFDMVNGAQSIAVRHAVYGTDDSSTWALISSTDQGASWSFVGSEITTSSTSLNTATFVVEDSQSVRYGIYKTSNDANRLNIDNIEIILESSSTTAPTQDSNLTFGNPSDADTTSDNNYFLAKDDFSLSYNNSRGTANWVSWHLSEAWTGDQDRCDCFRQDTTLPSSFYRPTTDDYTNTGFDRGHICPSADRNLTEESNENTFFMSNIAPQAPDNNRGCWANFETYLRSLTLEGNEIHIIAGVNGMGGTGSNGFANTIDSEQITVSDSFWKVALVLSNGSSDINRVNESTRMIAINVPNNQDVSTDWTDFITTVDAIENLTGYDLFENISDSVESILESTEDGGLIQ